MTVIKGAVVDKIFESKEINETSLPIILFSSRQASIAWLAKVCDEINNIVMSWYFNNKFLKSLLLSTF